MQENSETYACGFFEIAFVFLYRARAQSEKPDRKPERRLQKLRGWANARRYAHKRDGAEEIQELQGYLAAQAKILYNSIHNHDDTAVSHERGMI